MIALRDNHIVHVVRVLGVAGCRREADRIDDVVPG